MTRRRIEECHPPIERLAWRLDEVAKALGISRRTFERERAAGRFPAPDLKIGTAPLWRPMTVRAWIEEQSRKGERNGGGL
jgi:predicted DNA-binding transcriptional regulator AlpA